ncbi:uncharacterized protein [Drosophila tropicalis]|uniref:uncharacterized protein n=1 Tax=Drosophila tropicalis TaxID=46794 RepID=UPI0035AB6A07
MIITNFEKMNKPNFIIIILFVGFLWDCFLPMAWGKPYASNWQQQQKQQQQSIMDPDAMFNYDDCDPQQGSQDYLDAGLIGDYSELDKDTRWQCQPSDVAAADALLAAGYGQQSLKSLNVCNAFASPQLENDESLNDIDFSFDDSEEQVIERSNAKQLEYQPKRAQPAKLHHGLAGRRHRQNQHQKKHELNEIDFGMEDEIEGLDGQPQ